MIAAQIGLAVCIIVLFLLVLSTMREIVLLRGEVAALSQLITKPPTPAVVGNPLPGPLRITVLNTSIDGRANGHDARRVLLFLDDICGSCNALVETVHASVTTGEIEPSHLICVVRSDPNHDLAGPLRRQGVDVVQDPQGSLANECGVRRSPMLLAVSTADGYGLDYVYGGDVKWILRQLRYEAAPDTLTGGPSTSG